MQERGCIGSVGPPHHLQYLLLGDGSKPFPPRLHLPAQLVQPRLQHGTQHNAVYASDDNQGKQCAHEC